MGGGNDEPVDGQYRYFIWKCNSVPATANAGIAQYSEFSLNNEPLTYMNSITSMILSGEGAENLFDGSTATKWCGIQGGDYVKFSTNVPVKPTVFSMTTANDNASGLERYALSWTLYASNNAESTDVTDGTWTVLLNGAGDSSMNVNYTRFDYSICENGGGQ